MKTKHMEYKLIIRLLNLQQRLNIWKYQNNTFSTYVEQLHSNDLQSMFSVPLPELVSILFLNFSDNEKSGEANLYWSQTEDAVYSHYVT